MLPREFLAVYGRPVLQTVAIPGFETWTIPADPDRYLLILWGTSGSVRVLPDNLDGGTLAFMTWQAADPPHVFTHALHGSFVNESFRILAAGGATTVSFVTGCMLPPTPRQVRKSNVGANLQALPRARKR